MTTLFKFASMALIVLSFLTGCNREIITGTGDAEQETRDIQAFSGLNVNGNYAILGTVGEPTTLVISSNPNILPHIKSSIDDDILIIKNDDHVNLQPSVSQNIWFTTKSLQVLELSGNIQFQMLDLNTEKLDLSLKGSDKLLLEGKVTRLKMITTGSAEVNAKDLQVKDAEIEINGSGIVHINVIDNLKVKINGDGQVIYYDGRPIIEQVINGSGQVASAFGVLEESTAKGVVNSNVQPSSK